MRQGRANPGPDLRLKWLLLRSVSSQLHSVTGGCSAIVIVRLGVASIETTGREVVSSAIVATLLDGFQSGDGKAASLDTLLILGVLSKILHRRHACRQHRKPDQPCRTLPKCIRLASASQHPETGANGDVPVARQSGNCNRHLQRSLWPGTNPRALVAPKRRLTGGHGQWHEAGTAIIGRAHLVASHSTVYPCYRITSNRKVRSSVRLGPPSWTKSRTFHIRFTLGL